MLLMVVIFCFFKRMKRIWELNIGVFCPRVLYFQEIMWLHVYLNHEHHTII